MKDSILFTIIAGVSVFVCGQFILKLVLEPIVSFKESIGELSSFCLCHRAKINNANATIELQSELRSLISKIISKKQSIPLYSFVSAILKLPTENDIVNSSRSLNYIAYEMVKDTSQHNGSVEGCNKISLELENVSTLLKVRLDYTEL